MALDFPASPTDQDLSLQGNGVTYKWDATLTRWDIVDNAGPADLSRVVQVVNTQDGAVATGTTVLPIDDTIPQNTEGDEYMTLAITPTNSSNLLRIDVVINVGHSSTPTHLAAALFQDSTAGALAACSQAKDNNTNTRSCVVFTHWMTAGTVSSTTFKVRAGSASAGTTTFNGISAGRIFGGVMASSITITEFNSGSVGNPAGLAAITTGSWSPVLSDLTNDGTMAAETDGTYTKIGNMVSIVGRARLSSVGSISGDVYIEGLPFDNGTVECGVSVGYIANLSITAGENVGGYITTSSNYIRLRLHDTTTGTSNLQGSELTATSDFMFSFTYHTAS